MKTARIALLISVAVVLSITCSVFLLKPEKRTTQDAQGGIRLVRKGVATTKPLNDASQQPIRQQPGSRKPSAKTIEADFGGQQPKRKSKRSASTVNEKPRADLKAPVPAAAEVSSVEQQIAKKYDEMFAGQDTKLFKDPFSAAHRLVKNEKVDETWAPEASQVLVDSFSDYSSRLDVSMINCRTDICEIHINSWPGEDYTGVMNLAKDRLEFIKQQPWFKQYFDETASLGAFLDDGLPLMVIFVTRK